MYCQPISLHFYKIAVAICTAEMLLSRELVVGKCTSSRRLYTKISHVYRFLGISGDLSVKKNESVINAHPSCINISKYS